jgi:aspartyl-tRNA(Asn)/glutamyl-tRNA(Gln) amidotransferase subunit C
MDLNREQIEHIANLARLDLTEEELDTYGKQISGILNYIDQLREVDTSDVEPTAQVSGLVDVLREDKVEKWDEGEREKALEQASELEDGQVKVGRVL